MLSETCTVPFSFIFLLFPQLFSPLFYYFSFPQTWACEWQVSSSALQPSCFCLISCRQVTVSNHPSGSAVPRGAQASLPSWSTGLRAQAGCTFLCSLVLANIVKREGEGGQLKLDLCKLWGSKLGNILLQISRHLQLLLPCLNSLPTCSPCLFSLFQSYAPCDLII